MKMMLVPVIRLNCRIAYRSQNNGKLILHDNEEAFGDPGDP